MNKIFQVLMALGLHTTTPTLRHVADNRYLAINPLQTNIKMKINCGSDFSLETLDVWAGTSLEVTLQKPNGQPAACFMASYTKTKQ